MTNALRAPSTRLVGLGRGKVYFNPQNSSGVLQGFFPLGNTKKLSITTTPNTTKVKDFTSEASAPYAEIVDATELALAMEGFELSEDVLQLATLGDSTSITQAAASVTNEILVPAAATDILGRVYRTAFRKISALTIDIGGTPLVLGTDYAVEDADLGLIRILPGSIVAVAGTDILIDYTHAALTGATALAVVRGAVKGGISGQLLYVPGNTNGPKRELHIHNCTITPDGENDMISDDVNTWKLKGTILSDAAGAYGGSVSDPFYNLVNR